LLPFSKKQEILEVAIVNKGALGLPALHFPKKKQRKQCTWCRACGAANGLLNKKTQIGECFSHWQTMLPDWGYCFFELSTGFFLESRPDWGNTE